MEKWRERPGPQEESGEISSRIDGADLARAIGGSGAASGELNTRAPALGLLDRDSPCVSCGKREALGEETCAHCGCARVAGNYRIVRVLAESERGRVYLAVDGAGRRVALKELVFATVPGAQQVEQFHRESRVLRQLNHPAIPRFVDAFQTGAGVRTRLVLAQEFVEGKSLLARLQEGRLEEAEAKSIAAQVLPILEYLHGLEPRLIHRDLKPANLIQRTGGAIALVDFDAARALHAQRTHGASLAGTFGYMPIEQLGGTVDATSDLHALGATLIHLLSGRPPQELLGPSLELRFAEHIEASPGFSSWLGRLVAREHAQRFVSARAAAAALRALELRSGDHSSASNADAGEEELAFASLVESESKEDRRQRFYRRAIVAGTIAFALILAGGTAFFVLERAPSSSRSATARSAVDAQPAESGAQKRLLDLSRVVWDAPFGKVTVRKAFYDPDEQGLRVQFVISPIPAAGWPGRMLAHLEGPGAVWIDAAPPFDIKLDLGPQTEGRQQLPNAVSFEQTFPFSLDKIAAPTTLVLGDSLRVPLDFGR